MIWLALSMGLSTDANFVWMVRQSVQFSCFSGDGDVGPHAPGHPDDGPQLDVRRIVRATGRPLISRGSSSVTK